MQPLKLSSAPDSVAALKNRYSGKNDSLLELFPKPQYFKMNSQYLGY
jgi:hypothetical protein